MSRLSRYVGYLLIVVAAAAIGTVLGVVLMPTPETPNPGLNPTEMSPIYRGETLSWDEANRLQDSGRATNTLLFSDEDGDYVLLFDTVRQLTRWECRHTSPDPSSC